MCIIGLNSKQKRILTLIEILKKRNGSSIKELSLELKVSEMTIHRDLKTLKAHNIIKIVHGAAIYNPDSFKLSPNLEQYNVLQKQGVLHKEKQKIAKLAASLIEENDTIAIDIGTTTQDIAKFIKADSTVSVMCFTMNTLSLLLEKSLKSLMLSGGHYHKGTQLFECEQSISFIKTQKFSKYFMSIAGIDKNFGLSCANSYEVSTKQACIKAASQKILVCDSSKFEKAEAAYFADLSDVDTIVTDENIPKHWISFIKNKKITLHIV